MTVKQKPGARVAAALYARIARTSLRRMVERDASLSTSFSARAVMRDFGRKMEGGRLTVMTSGEDEEDRRPTARRRRRRRRRYLRFRSLMA
jgi:hypothetical protein